MRTRPVVLASLILLTPALQAQSPPIDDQVDRAAAFLRDAQNEDGSYGTPSHTIRTTSLVLQALAGSHRHYTDADGPFMRRASRCLERALGPDGGAAGESLAGRLEATAWIILGLQASGPSRHRPTLRAARDFIARQAAPADPRLGAILARAAGTPPAAGASLPGRLTGVDWLLELRSLDRDLKKRLEATAEPDQATEALQQILSRQKELGAFDLGGEAVEDTALSLIAVESLSHALAGPDDAADREAGDRGSDSASASTRRAPAPIEIPRDLDARDRNGALKALAFLAGQQDEGRFGFGPYQDPGITALCLTAVLRTCRRLAVAEPPWARKGLDYLASLSHPDGAIYQQGLKVYVTSAAVMALVASGRETYRPTIDKARDYLVAVQADEGEGYSSEEDWAYGGIGYGGDLRPDLSNTQFGLEALHDAGLPADDAAFQRALVFLQRCQNDEEGGGGMVIESEGRTVVPGRDGGAGYAPGASKAGLVEVGEGRWAARSYGSMTYALLKSYLFAGLDRDDPRVEAAATWIRNHYTLEENPGFDRNRDPDAGQQGLFYYYFTMAKALDALGVTSVLDRQGGAHRWKDELATKLLSMQGENGAWLNSRSERWLEGNPVLATAYALVTLSYCR